MMIPRVAVCDQQPGAPKCGTEYFHDFHVAATNTFVSMDRSTGATYFGHHPGSEARTYYICAPPALCSAGALRASQVLYEVGDRLQYMRTPQS